MFRQIIGWILWGIATAYSILGILFVSREANAGRTFSYMFFFQLTAMAALAIIFFVIDSSKLHLAWLIPLCWVLSFTPIGTAVGRVVAESLGFSRKK
ncbi:MAG: hypothetical protein ACHQZQ_05995 [SAR324 cluster bacterium]